MLTMTFGAKLSALMKRNGLTRSAVKDAIGASSENTISNYVIGKTTPDLEKAFKLAKLLGVTLDYLADDTLDEPTETGGPGLSERDRELLNIIKKIGHDRAERRLLGIPSPDDVKQGWD